MTIDISEIRRSSAPLGLYLAQAPPASCWRSSSPTLAAGVSSADSHLRL